MTWFKNGINQKVSVQKQKHEAISKGQSKYQKKKMTEIRSSVSIIMNTLNILLKERILD